MFDKYEVFLNLYSEQLERQIPPTISRSAKMAMLLLGILREGSALERITNVFAGTYEKERRIFESKIKKLKNDYTEIKQSLDNLKDFLFSLGKKKEELEEKEQKINDAFNIRLEAEVSRERTKLEIRKQELEKRIKDFEEKNKPEILKEQINALEGLVASISTKDADVERFLFQFQYKNPSLKQTMYIPDFYFVDTQRAKEVKEAVIALINNKITSLKTLLDKKTEDSSF